jgi:F-type H+-transporting ATPase subunit b
MASLFSQLGISVPALLAQGINFLVVFLVLSYLLYKPLLKLVADRRREIEQGLEDAKSAHEKLGEAEARKAVLLKEAEQIALLKIKEAEKQALLEGEKIMTKTQTKADELLAEAAEVAKRRKLEELGAVEQEAKELIKSIFEKTVKMKPQTVDEALINEAIMAVKNS